MSIIGVLFNPAGRINAGQFWIALAMVAVIATALVFATFAAPALSSLFSILSLVTLYMTVCVFSKRFHDKGMSGFLAMIPLVVSFLGASFGLVGSMLPPYIDLARPVVAERGVDAANDEAVLEALQDPDVQAEIQERLMADTEAQQAIMKAVAWPTHIGGWIGLLIGGFWAGFGQRRESNRHGEPA